jgi:ABC-type transporter Mla subunit MlaD
MNETTLLYVMTAFVIISAIALCIQAGMLAGIYKTIKSLQESINPLVPKVESLVANANLTVEQSGRQITEVTARANDILDSTRRQLAIVEEVVGDAAVRAKVQMERVELVLDDTLSRAHETVAVFHDGIMRPLREVSAVAAGIRAAVGALARGDRPTVDRATSDEEMFI